MINRTVWMWLGLGFVAALAVAKSNVFSSEPVYGGLSVEGFNYMPLNLSEFTIRDRYGNTASGGGDLMPGAGEGSLSCCYKLKGTEFTVEWDAYDADEAIKHIYDGPIKKTHYVAKFKIPPTKVSHHVGKVILGVHFYPDEHVEAEFRSDLGGTRIDYGEVWGWLMDTKKSLIDPEVFNDEMVYAANFRKFSKIMADAWLKYGFTNSGDLEQYCYFFLLNKDFEKNLSVKKILASAKATPGAFGRAMQALPASVVQEIKAQKNLV
ncbi:hypothetical protein [Paraburkholderia sp. J76]|uniref:hypothetical protein n=1 Tax=Paraburkholderia sp. J76 TaxID=2805439 RepID=UPI002ABE11EC|nr:hypothetical protein [Paraburkholderia sp. J76]